MGHFGSLICEIPSSSIAKTAHKDAGKGLDYHYDSRHRVYGREPADHLIRRMEMEGEAGRHGEFECGRTVVG